MKLVQSQLEYHIYGISIFATEFHPRKKICPLTDTIKLVQPQLKPLIYGIAILATEFHQRTKYKAFDGHYYTWPATAGTPDLRYCYFGN